MLYGANKMTKQNEALKMAIKALLTGHHHKELCDEAVHACKEALAECEQAEPVLFIDQGGLDGHATWAQPNACQDTDIPLYTYPTPNQLPIPTIAKGRDEIYYAWRKYWAWGIPSKDGEAVFNANADGFQAGWLACEKWIKEQTK